MKRLSLVAAFFILLTNVCLAQYPATARFANSSLQDMVGKTNMSIHYALTHEYNGKLDEILSKSSDDTFTAAYVVTGSTVMFEIEQGICVGVILMLPVTEFKTVYNYYNNSSSLLRVTDGIWVSTADRKRFSIKPLSDESGFILQVKKI